MADGVAWESRGKMTICEKGRPKFPKVDSSPGLYRLTLDNGWHYIGEARDLEHRLSEYRRPTTGVVQEHRLHEALKEAGGAIVEIFVGKHLFEKVTRCTLEAEEVRAARRQGKKVLNGGGDSQAYCIHLDIKYHELQIAKLRRKLETIATEEE